MKKSLLLLAFCTVSVFASEVNLIPNADGKDNFKNWYKPASSNISAANGIITITANLAPKVNPYQKAQMTVALTGAAVQGKKFELSFKYRTEKLNGVLQVAVRESNQKSGIYHGVTLKRWDVSREWKEKKYVFTTAKDAKVLCFYLVGRYMKSGEKVELKDIKLIAK